MWRCVTIYNHSTIYGNTMSYKSTINWDPATIYGNKMLYKSAIN